MVNGIALGNAGFKYLGVPYSEMDCQAFVEKCLSDCGEKIDLAGSNAWYRECAKNGAVMTPEECVKNLGCVPSGAFLFILEQDGKEPAKYKPDGMGNASHIGICTGTRGQGAIHSSASRGCVAESKFNGKTIKNGGWNRVGLWNEVSYDYGGGDTPEPEPAPEPSPYPMTATVWADNGKPVNLRKHQSTLSALVDRVPCGETVAVLEYGSEWSHVEWNKKTGYMMTRFLVFDDLDNFYTVTVPHLSISQAEALTRQYPGSTMTEERG